VKRALVFSALGRHSGCALRARYLKDALRRRGWDARLLLPLFPNLPLSLEAFLAVPRFALAAAFSRAELAVAIKPYPNCWLALWILKLKGVKVVMDVDDWDGAWRGGLLGSLAALVQAPAFRLLPLFSTHHPGIRRKLGGGALSLGQGVDTSIFHPRRGKPAKVLVFTAHLNVACQLDLLMDWVGPWLKAHPDWSLLVAGGGPKLGEYRRRHASAQVRFSGPLSPEAVAEAVAGARICLSAYGEGGGNEFRVPMKAGEYLAMGKPLATNYISGLAPLKPYLYLSQPGPKAFGRLLDRLAAGKGDGREKRGTALSWDAALGRFLKELA
jgi:glycosyltransferase involved in cell wall biosynthesis